MVNSILFLINVKGGNMNVKKKPLYHAWRAMRQRCRYKKHHSYQWYGAVGVQIADEWNNFYNYQNWCLENGWKQGMVVSRKNDTGNYSPQNCEIITKSENSRISATRSFLNGKSKIKSIKK